MMRWIKMALNNVIATMKKRKKRKRGKTNKKRQNSKTR